MSDNSNVILEVQNLKKFFPVKIFIPNSSNLTNVEEKYFSFIFFSREKNLTNSKSLFIILIGLSFEHKHMTDIRNCPSR